ncbi:hypothetical protein Pelo_19022 [Pelomyxa schiedti]|nr:hypothetical protein Pelo_19022 [Pelomyxa schiedti]
MDPFLLSDDDLGDLDFPPSNSGVVVGGSDANVADAADTSAGDLLDDASNFDITPNKTSANYQLAPTTSTTSTTTTTSGAADNDDSVVADEEAKKTKEEELKATIHYDLANYVRSQNKKFEMTPHTVASLSEVVYEYIVSHATDVMYFATHAKRTTGRAADVLLCTRKNPQLQSQISAFISECESHKHAKRPRTVTPRAPRGGAASLLKQGRGKAQSDGLDGAKPTKKTTRKRPPPKDS